VQLVVLSIGRSRDRELETLCAEYVHRSRGLLPITLETCRDRTAWRARMDRLERPLVVLDERGEQLDTADLAGWLRSWRDAGTRRVTFAIGDADGFDAEDRDRSDRLLALSRLTLAHRIARLVLVEQLYRASTILAGHPYHRG
jgi:23S rRNA (pseudouridine1915-N3)-methyltransferase